MVTATAHEHADKYNDPRVKVTRRGLLLGVGVVVFAILGTALSVTMRRTQLEKTTEFFGAETILALQLGERIQMLPRANAAFQADDAVELTATPGLGHLRRALLDDRHYDWSSVQDQPVTELCAESDSLCVQLLILDPTAHRVAPVRLDLELNSGWVGLEGVDRRVRVNERVQPALRHFLQTLQNVKQRSYDDRQ